MKIEERILSKLKQEHSEFNNTQQKLTRPYLKNKPHSKRIGGKAQVVDQLSKKHETTLSTSNDQP
jgi:hypothetical protein